MKTPLKQKKTYRNEMDYLRDKGKEYDKKVEKQKVKTNKTKK